MTVTPEPDTKDWTWVLGAPCPECGFVAADVEPAAVGTAIRQNAEVWTAVLGTARAGVRPAPAVWSPTEYGCHVRDVHRTFAARLRLMLDQHEPTFANWDQDVTAVEDRYDLQDAATVAPALAEAATAVADLYDTVQAHQLDRRGLRSNGSEFTVASIGRYHLHDVVHHLWDVRMAVTVAAYDGVAAAYADASAAATVALGAAHEAFAARLGSGARVLEIGTGGGRDGLALEARGLVVRRTDVTPAFVDRLRQAGHEAEVLDPLTDELPPGMDGVWANASLLHVARADLPNVLARLAGATRPGGVLHASFKEGDGEGWSTHGTVRLPRMFTYWREDGLRAALATAGWDVEDVARADGQRGERWLTVTAVRG